MKFKDAEPGSCQGIAFVGVDHEHIYVTEKLTVAQAWKLHEWLIGVLPRKRANYVCTRCRNKWTSTGYEDNAYICECCEKSDKTLMLVGTVQDFDNSGEGVKP